MITDRGRPVLKIVPDPRSDRNDRPGPGSTKPPAPARSSSRRSARRPTAGTAANAGTLEVEEWIARSEALPYLHFLPVDNRIAGRSVHLPAPLHPDPADRIIVATAFALTADVVTKDRRLRHYSPLRTVW